MGAETKRTTEHDTIREWVERRGGTPASVRDTESDDDDARMLHIDFPHDAGEESLEHISWEEWFRQFDEKELCFLYQDERASGESSTFCKLLERGAS
jgi:hypothetical protein